MFCSLGLTAVRLTFGQWAAFSQRSMEGPFRAVSSPGSFSFGMFWRAPCFGTPEFDTQSHTFPCVLFDIGSAQLGLLFPLAIANKTVNIEIQVVFSLSVLPSYFCRTLKCQVRGHQYAGRADKGDVGESEDSRMLAQALRC